jgi:hypothetical protein
MNVDTHDRIDEHRAAALLGLPKAELRRYSQVSGLGQLEEDGQGQQMIFTFDELCRLCLLVAQSSK